MDKQVLISFHNGKYEDEVLCDVVSMQVEHLLTASPTSTHSCTTNGQSILFL